MLYATFELAFSKKEASKRGIGGRSTFWPTGCVIFCQKGHHWLPSWFHHRLQWLPSQRPSRRCPGKLTGATQYSVGAVNRIR